MLSPSQKVIYLLNSTLRYFEPIKCPFCSSDKHILVDRKYIVTRLYECEECGLYFRHPLERISQNKNFYESEYKEKDNVTALLPDKIALNEMIANNFDQGNKNADRYVRLFRSIFPYQEKLKVIDYGCSWGYTTFQLLEAGYDVQGFEISSVRAAYGNRHLHLDIKTAENDLRSGNDLFFSAHVIEHHPDIMAMISLAKRIISRDGYFIAISPNGSREYRKKNPSSFHHAWGKVHPNYLNTEFYQTIFKDQYFYIGSSPFNLENIKCWENKQLIDKTDGEELIVIVKLNKNIAGDP